MKQYNGHRSWNAWNVALWIGNDESIYRFAMDCIKVNGGDIRKATRRFMRDYQHGMTPDGAKYNTLSVKLALQGLAE